MHYYKTLTNRATHLCKCRLGIEGAADPLKTSSFPIYVTTAIRSALKGVVIITGEPQNWGAMALCSLGVGGVADSKIYAPPPHLLLCRKMGVLR